MKRFKIKKMLSGNTLKITNFFRYTTQNKQAKFIKSITPFSFFQRRGECSSCSSLDLEIGFSRKKEIIKSKIGEYSSHLFFSSGKDNWDKDYPQNEEKSVQLFFDSIREYNASNPIPTAYSLLFIYLLLIAQFLFILIIGLFL